VPKNSNPILHDGHDSVLIPDFVAAQNPVLVPHNGRCSDFVLPDLVVDLVDKNDSGLIRAFCVRSIPAAVFL
jgi:hypothetical protein